MRAVPFHHQRQVDARIPILAGMAMMVLSLHGMSQFGTEASIEAVVWLGVLHQAGAAIVLATATVNLWLVLRAQPRIFMSGPRTMGL